MKLTQIKWLFALVLIGLLANLSSAQEPTKKQLKKLKKKEKFEEFDLDTVNVKPFNAILDYKAVPTKYFILLHTKLELLPVVEEKKLKGRATLKLSPHFYPQHQLVLDAKGMLIHSVTLGNDSLKFNYDGFKLNVDLGREYTRKDTFQLLIDYVAQPYQLDPATVKMGRGMYFINPHQTNPYKPTHIWTQGETEAASCWFPTIEATYQKTTQEIYVTVDEKFTTFSNGLLLSQTNNNNGTRTDYWKQSLPHAPYLFTLAIGEYQKYSDKWRDIEVNYFTFPKYFKDVKQVFGRTPQMMEHFSKILGVDYPWEKYDQIITYDYTAGAMENTGASVFYEYLFCNHRELADLEHGHDLIIAHELFHQWFGDLVTCENWSQLTLNESFANYSEQLWLEEWKGADDAEIKWFSDFNSYLHEFRNIKSEPIVYFYYSHPDEVFDRHRYNKGGRVLHSLRTYLGDEAFFEALKYYLTLYRFGATEIEDLRLAFEKVTGEDLNWFFNQWWHNAGHPMVKLSHSYNEENKTVEFKINQLQKKFDRVFIPTHKIPLDIDIIFENETVRHRVWVQSESDVFYFPAAVAPLAVNVDPGKMQVWEREDQLSTAELLVIFDKSDKILDKVFAFNFLKERQSEDVVKIFMENMLMHSNAFLRKKAISSIRWHLVKDKSATEAQLKLIATKDPHPDVRREALTEISNISKASAFAIAESAFATDTSYFVLSRALEIIADSSIAAAYPYAAPLDTIENYLITSAVARVYSDSAISAHFPFFERAMMMQWSYSTNALNSAFRNYLIKMEDVETFRKGLELLKNIIENEETDRHIQNAKSIITKLIEVQNKNVKEYGQVFSSAKRAVLQEYEYLRKE